jgi:hypothetical protein
MMKTRIFAVLLFAGACGSSAEPADPQTARQRTAESLGILDEAADSIAFTVESDTLASTEGSMASMNGSVDSPFFFPEDLRFVTPPAAGEPTWSEEARQFLEERVFIDANYEGDGVYRLRGEDFCPADELTGAPDPQCVADFNEAELRVRAVLAGDGLDLTLLVGPDRVEPLTVELRSDRITVIVDLGAAKAAAAHIAAVTGTAVELPRILEGVVSAELVLNGPADVTVSFAIRQAVRVEGDLEAGSYLFSSAAKDPLFRARGEGAARRLSIDLDIGQTAVSFPWDSFSFDETEDPTPVSGQLAVDAKGLSGSVVLEEGISQLRLSNIGLGEGKSTIKLDDYEILSWLLNADSGSRFGLTVTPTTDGTARFAFDPELDFQLGVDLQPFADAGDVVEPYLLGEVYRVEIDGTTPTVRPVPADAYGIGGGLSVDSGRLRLSASSGSEVVVPAGQCLVDDAVTTGEHPLIGAYASAPCE